MESKEVLGLIKELAEYETKAGLLHEKLRKIYPFDECMCWGVTGIYTECTIEDGCLYDSRGNLLSNDDGCMDEGIPYFVNQTTGYCEDDYSREEALKFTKADFDKNPALFKAVEASIPKWGK